MKNEFWKGFACGFAIAFTVTSWLSVRFMIDLWTFTAK